MKLGGSRRKGHAFEREVAHRLAAIFGEAKRGLSQCRGGTCEEPDVVLPEGVPLLVECKAHARTNIRKAVEQAVQALPAAFETSPLRWALAVTKDDRRTPLATMPLADFEQLLAEWWSLKRQAAHVAAAGDELESALTEQESR